MVTIIIPAYNAEDYIESTLHSVLAYSGDLVSEVVICNDASRDRTSALISDFIERHSLSANWRLIHHTENRGGAAARNSAVEASSNEWIFCLDSDNVLTNGVINHLYGLSVRHPNASVFSLKRIDFFVNFYGLNITTHSWSFPSGQYTLNDHLSNTESPGSSGNYLFSKVAWKDASGYRTDSHSLDSWCFALDILNNDHSMIVSDSDKYFYKHRYGINSYWVRESSKQNICDIGARLLRASKPVLRHVDYTVIDNTDLTSFDLERLSLVKPTNRPTKVKQKSPLIMLIRIIKKIV